MNRRLLKWLARCQTACVARKASRSVQRILVTFAVVCVATGSVASHPAVAADKTPDLATIRAAVDFYTASIKTLEGKCVSKWSRGPNSPGQKRPPAHQRLAI